jgi:hypothetical protein
VNVNVTMADGSNVVLANVKTVGDLQRRLIAIGVSRIKRVDERQAVKGASLSK